MKLNELINPDLLNEMREQKYIRVNTHPEAPLRIFNYTEIAAFSKTWNEATMTCRGLIVDDAGIVIARPFTKFFNAGERDGEGLPTNEPVTVTDKMDGSLGILYTTGGEPWIATRGSFTSDQAIHATTVYRERYHGTWNPCGDCCTYLFEIVYPQNRIVLDYGSMDDLVLLGAVNIQTGASYSPDEVVRDTGWAGPVAETFPYASYTEALAAEPRANAEGVVVHFRDSDMRVKLKQADYVRLHKIVTGTSTIGVWEHLRTGADMEALLENVPDEFFDWVKATTTDLTNKHNALTSEARKVYATIPTEDRKTFALAAATHGNLRPALFALLDGKSIDDWAWKLIRPVHQLPFKQSEAVA